MADVTKEVGVATYEVEVRGPLPLAVLRAVPQLQVCPHNVETVIHRELRGPAGWAKMDALFEDLQSLGLRLAEVRVCRRRDTSSDSRPAEAGETDAR